MKKFKAHTNEELIPHIEDGNEEALEQLFRNLRPIILHEAEMYRGRMATYDTDDFLQEGDLLRSSASTEKKRNSSPLGYDPRCSL